MLHDVFSKATTAVADMLCPIDDILWGVEGIANETEVGPEMEHFWFETVTFVVLPLPFLVVTGIF
jgi:hypothetical protein